jgi:hypothetical protein
LSARFKFIWIFIKLPFKQKNRMSTKTITSEYKGETITIIADTNYGGAITSLTWSGIQFVQVPPLPAQKGQNGQELQSALHSYEYEGSWGGECYNPTEGGANADLGTSSTTVATLSTTGTNVLKSSADLAFWAAPGQTSPGCPTGAKNTSTVSGVTFQKTVTLGFDANIPNAIEFAVGFTLPTGYLYTGFNFLEAIAWYFPNINNAEFNTFLQYNPLTAETTNVTQTVIDDSGAAIIQANYPVILSYTNGDYQGAIYSPQVQALTNYNYDQAYLNVGDNGVNKLGLAFYVANLEIGVFYSATFYLVIGSQIDVINGLASLIAVYPPPPPDISYPTNNYTFVEAVAIPDLLLTNLGGPANYSISPNLPAGLIINATTGEISGTPTGLSSYAYTVTGTGPGGSGTFKVSIAVVAAVAFIITNNSNNSIAYDFNGIDGTSAVVDGECLANSGTNPYILVPTGTYEISISPAGTPENCYMLFNTGQSNNGTPGAEFSPISVSDTQTNSLTITNTP